MAKEPITQEKTTAKLVKVKLLCVYSGWKVETYPGDIIEVDADEADRLAGVGGAVKLAP
jgi:hypothetical protein